MSLWELTGGVFHELERTDFGREGVRERQDLQSVLRDNVQALAPDVLVIAEEFSDWEDANLRIDLLGIDRDANLVVIELKRTESGGHSELQAIRYASMVSSMTFAQATSAFRSYLDRRGRDGETAEATLLKFLGWDEPDEEQFALDVRIVLGAADFSKPLTSAVLWPRDRGVDIRCVRMRPHRLTADDDRLLLDIQQVVPLPEAAEYQVRIAQKVQKQRTERAASRDMRRFDIQVQGRQHENLAKNRAALAVVRALVEELETPPERILEETSEGRRRKSRPLLLGFDHFERMLERISKTAVDGYPPYNIERIDDNRLNITLAVAGFFTEDLEVSIENNQLMIHGKQIDDPDRLYLHRGIAARQFQRSFVLAEGIEVTGASLDNGLLSIDLACPEPQTRRRNIVIHKVERSTPSVTMAANTKDQSS